MVTDARRQAFNSTMAMLMLKIETITPEEREVNNSDSVMHTLISRLTEASIQAEAYLT